MLRTPRSPSFPAGRAALLASSLLLAASGSCSLLVETASEQCQSDGDCAPFSGSVCDPGLHVCVARNGGGGAGGTPDAGGGSGGGGGCYAGTPSSNAQFLNACTTVTCQPFDNRTRLTRLTADGGLPPIP
jgi:hypothetical protein